VAPSAPVQDDERAISPISTTSSASEPPLAQRIRSNGVNHTPNSSSASAQAQGDVQEHVPEPSGPSTPLRHAPVS
jgi:SWI/SNF-related matrix-associated actin-dependent regulator of chromatin subfamily B protein 1